MVRMTSLVMGFSLLVSCSDTVPASIDIDIPGSIVGPASVPYGLRVLNASGEALNGHDVKLSVLPSEVAVVEADGVRCLKSGKASAIAAGAGLNADVELDCTVVSAINMPEKLFVIAGEEPLPLPVMLMDHDGNEVTSLTPEITTTNADVLSIENAAVVGKATGVASVVAKLHNVEARALAEVVEIDSVDVPAKFSVPLSRAKGRLLTVKVKTVDGRLLEEANVSLSSTDPRMEIHNGSYVVAKELVAAELQVRVAGQEYPVQAFAVEEFSPVPLNIRDGNQTSIEFSPGSYLVTVKNRSNNGAHWGLTARWMGTDCRGSSEAKEFFLVCDVRSPSTLVLENPTNFGLGPAQVGTLTRLRTAIPAAEAVDYFAEYRQGGQK